MAETLKASLKPSDSAGDDTVSISHLSVTHVGRQNLADTLPPHESYEGRHRWDPTLTWTIHEERKVIRKTDLYFLSWICVMVCQTCCVG